MKYRLRKDRFYRTRGGCSSLIRVSCSYCKAHICVYQKDGSGNLHRLYLDRILSHAGVFNIPICDNVTSKNELQPLVCTCRTLIAVPMVYKKEGRLAFRLIHGTINKNNVT